MQFVLKRLMDTEVLNEMLSMLTRQAATAQSHPLMISYQPNRPKLLLYPGYPFNSTRGPHKQELQEVALTLEREWLCARWR